jgi:hypothetical protein
MKYKIIDFHPEDAFYFRVLGADVRGRTGNWLSKSDGKFSLHGSPYRRGYFMIDSPAIGGVQTKCYFAAVLVERVKENKPWLKSFLEKLFG